jgi:hypothetical protein
MVARCLADGLCQETITRSSGPTRTDLAALNRSLWRNINSTRNYQRPI